MEGWTQSDPGVGCDMESPPQAGREGGREEKRHTDSRGALGLTFLGGAQESSDARKPTQHGAWQWTWRPRVAEAEPDAA